MGCPHERGALASGSVDGIAAEMGIDAAEIAARKAFLELGPADAERLRAMRSQLAAAQNGFADGFYAYLRQLPELAALLPDEATVARLKHAHGRYFATLTEGSYDAAYVADRLRVGMTHARIGLTPKWYVGAFRKYLADMLGATWTASGEDFATFAPAFDALLKVVMLDLGLTLDTYIHADKRAIALRDRAIESSVNGIFIAAAAADDCRLIYVNAACARILGTAQASAPGQPCPCTGDDDGFAVIRSAIAAGRDGYTTLSRPRSDGSQQWIELFLSPVRGDADSISHYVGILNDVTARKEAEAQLAFLASHDALTGLPNRSLFDERLHQALARDGRNDGFALCFIDLDRFKLINDSLGHAAGDAVLIEVARRLGAVCRNSDTLARLAGDEFVILLDGMGHADAAAGIASRILAALAAPVSAGGRDIDVAASLGLALYPDDGGDIASLLRNADAAMYAAKAAGRNTFRFYDAAMNRRASQRLALESDLRRAIIRGQLEVHYQPQLYSADGHLAGVDALLRWQHPERGLVSPVEFIPLAEEVGIITELGEWALAEAARQMVDWRARGIAVPRVAVNLSPDSSMPPTWPSACNESLPPLALLPPGSNWKSPSRRPWSPRKTPCRCCRSYANAASRSPRTISAPAIPRWPCCAACHSTSSSSTAASSATCRNRKPTRQWPAPSSPGPAASACRSSPNGWKPKPSAPSSPPSAAICCRDSCSPGRSAGRSSR